MSLHKNTERGKCFVRGALEPFLRPLLESLGVKLPDGVAKCDPDCVLYRKGMRYYEKDDRTEPFEECAFNISTDAVENQVQRTFAVQKEMGETKNAVLFQAIAGLTGSPEARGTLARMVQNAGGLNKLIGDDNDEKTQS